MLIIGRATCLQQCSGFTLMTDFLTEMLPVPKIKPHLILGNMSAHILFIYRHTHVYIYPQIF